MLGMSNKNTEIDEIERLRIEGGNIYSGIKMTKKKIDSFRDDIDLYKSYFSTCMENDENPGEIYTHMKKRANEIGKEVKTHKKSGERYVDKIKNLLPKFKK